MKSIRIFSPICLIVLMSLISHDVIAQSSNEYVIDKQWANLPDGMSWDGPTSWVDTDGRGNVLVFVRTAPYFRMFNREGDFVKAWGEDGFFQAAHSVTFDPNGFIWATDSSAHVVYKLNTDGQVLLTLGMKGLTGGNDSETLFNQPNHVAIAPNGDVYVTDGYVNSRVVHFSPEGEFIRVVGGIEGDGPGELKVPHGVAIDSEGRILVNDSDNQRIAVFSSDGVFLENWPYPSRGGIVVISGDTVYVSDVNAAMVHVVKEGKLIERIPVAARAHGLAVDTDGAIYVSDSLGRSVMKVYRAK
jgi:hypothetical protein